MLEEFDSFMGKVVKSYGTIRGVVIDIRSFIEIGDVENAKKQATRLAEALNILADELEQSRRFLK